MSYKKQTFVDNETILKASHLNHIEDGIENLDQTKQDTLVSGTNIKTINGESLLGEGDINIEVRDETITIDEALDENSVNAVQNKAVTIALTNKQDSLKKSGIDIKQNDDIAWGICDSEGNFALKLDNDGTFTVGNLKAIKSDIGNNVIEEDTNTPNSSWLVGKHCFVFGDSLSADTKL
jgi:hypothetical protein